MCNKTRKFIKNVMVNLLKVERIVIQQTLTFIQQLLKFESADIATSLFVFLESGMKYTQTVIYRKSESHFI